MDNKSAGNAVLGESTDVDAVLGVELEGYKVAITGLNGGISISIGVLVTTKGTESLG